MEVRPVHGIALFLMFIKELNKEAKFIIPKVIKKAHL